MKRAAETPASGKWGAGEGDRPVLAAPAGVFVRLALQATP